MTGEEEWGASSAVEGNGGAWCGEDGGGHGGEVVLHVDEEDGGLTSRSSTWLLLRIPAHAPAAWYICSIK